VLTGDSVKILVVWSLSVGGHDGLLLKERGDIETTEVGCGGSRLVALPVRKRRTPFMIVSEQNHHHLRSAVVVADVGHVLHLSMATVLRPISRECDPDARLNKGNKPPVIADRIEVVELEMGSQVCADTAVGIFSCIF